MKKIIFVLMSTHIHSISSVNKIQRLLIVCVLVVIMCNNLSGQVPDDPTLMIINNQPVLRSEFEYSYNKNNTEGVIDKKTVEEYVDLFINYKLKVFAALDDHLDTLTSYQQEFAQYRDMQTKPSIINDDDIEIEARKIYQNTKDEIGEKGLIRPAHIFLFLSPQAPSEEQMKVKERIDSIYRALLNGEDFALLAKKVSQDQASAPSGGELPWIGPNQSYKEFEEQAYALQPGEMSKPFISPAGYHIILMKERKQLEPYDSLRAEILAFINQRNIRERIINNKIDTLAAQAKMTKEEYLEHRADSMQAEDLELKYLIQEYHDGLLLFEVSNNNVWNKASTDEEGLAEYFSKNKKKYNWDEPRFKGMAYHVKVKSDVKAVKKCVKGLPFDKWAEALRTTFNSDSVIRIRVEKGIFKKGDNALVDRDAFRVDTVPSPMKDYPIDATYGKVLKNGPEEYTDVRSLVVADYQDELEKKWVEELRKRYTFSVNEDVLKTVNNHE